MPNPKLETYKNKATDTVYDLTDANAQAMIAPEFSTSKAYTTGQYVIYQGRMYKFTSDHAAGAWNSSHVSDAIDIGKALQYKENVITFDSGDFTDLGLGGSDGTGSRQVSLNKSTSPTNGDTKPITSDAVYDALQLKASASDISNIWDVNAKTGVHQLLKYDLAILKTLNTTGTWNDNVYTVNATTFTVDTDKISVSTASGGATGNIGFVLQNKAFLKDALESGVTYNLSGCPSGGSANTYAVQYTNAVNSAFSDVGSGIDVTKFDPTTYAGQKIQIYVKTGAELSNKEFKPLLKFASDKSSAISPYAMTNRELTERANVDYSTDEQDTGLKWIDGKPIYQKTIVGTLPTAVESIETFIVHGISNIDNVQIISSSAKATDDTWYSIGVADVWDAWINPSYIRNRIMQASLISQTGYITIQYTKTTD